MNVKPNSPLEAEYGADSARIQEIEESKQLQKEMLDDDEDCGCD